MISYYQAHSVTFMRSWFSYRHTAVKRLSMREKLRGDHVVRFEKPCKWLWRRTAASSCELEANFSFYFNINFITTWWKSCYVLWEKLLRDKNIGHWDWWVERGRDVNFLISFRRVSSILNLFVNLKFAEYPCFSVVMAGSLHFPKKNIFVYNICSSVLE